MWKTLVPYVMQPVPMLTEFITHEKGVTFIKLTVAVMSKILIFVGKL